MHLVGRRHRGLIGLLAFLMLAATIVVVAAPAQSVVVDPAVEGTVLVIAPHPDDDVITAAGITYNRPNTTIAYMTHGDSHTVVPVGTATTADPGVVLTDAGAAFVTDKVTPGLTVYNETDGSEGVIKTVDSEIKLTLEGSGLSGGTGNDWGLGDDYRIEAFIPDGIAETRQDEAVTAQGILGRTESELIFLGYPDYKLCRVWEQFDPDPTCQNYGDAPVIGGTGRTATYASRGLGGTDWHDYRMGPGVQHASYIRANMLADVVALVESVRPDHVFTTSPEDGTLDHQTTYHVVKAAMEQVHASDPDYVALLHSAVVWQNPADPILNNVWPDNPNAQSPHGAPPTPAERQALGFSGTFAPAWGDRETFSVPPALTDPSAANPKYRAIDAHASQDGMNPGSYIARFLHSDEFFWVEAIPEPTAVNDGPYQVNQGGSLSENGVLDNDTGVQLTAALKTQPSHGTVSLKTDGSFTYTHDGSTTATDSFTYRVQDPAGTFDDATVSITVKLDDPPPAPPPTGAGHTVGLVDPAMGEWHLYDDAGKELTSFFFGNPGDFPIVGDWDCDGEETPGMYRQSDGFVYLRNSNSQGVADIKFFFGDPGDVPLAGDFNGDGCDTVSIYRPAQSKVFIINELGENNGGLGEAEFSYFFGNPGDKPFVGDFNGNGEETVGLHRESTGLVYFRLTHTQGASDSQFIFGDPNDRLVAGDWNDNGAYSPALFRPSNTTSYFRYTNTAGNADATWVNGQSSWLPVSGDF
jgi:VCBS repeat-containing protein